jgi:hypothetical protein
MSAEDDDKEEVQEQKGTQEERKAWTNLDSDDAREFDISKAQQVIYLIGNLC